MGVYKSAEKYVGWPITPGFEVAGIVRAIGPLKADLKQSDYQKKHPIKVP